MPPRSAKKTPPGPGSKRALRGRAAAAAAAAEAEAQAQALAQASPEEPTVKSEELEVAEEGKQLAAVKKEPEHEEKFRVDEIAASEREEAFLNSKPISFSF